MSAKYSIAGALRRFGRPMLLKRPAIGADPAAEVTVYGSTDGAMIQRLVGSVVQLGSHVIFSNVDIAAASWPGPPMSGDTMVIDGTTRTIDAAEPKYLGTEILVHVCQVSGG